HAAVALGSGDHFAADRRAPQLAAGDLVQRDHFRLAGAIQHHAETSAHCPGYQVIAALPPFDIAAGAIDGRHRAIRTGGKDECTIDGWRQLIVVLALTITHLDAPEPLQTGLLLEV